MEKINYLFLLFIIFAFCSCSKDNPVSNTPTTSVPSKPLNLQIAMEYSNGNVELSWQTPGSNGGSVITRYLIYRA